MPHTLTVTPPLPCPVPEPDGGRCSRPAGYGTPHYGTGPCRQHEHREAAAARAACADRVPPAVFQEPRYLDGLPYEETAPVRLTDDEPDDWAAA